MVKRRKLQWYDHVSHSSGLAKAILQGTVKGGRRQGRQRKRWEDIIREWTGLDFDKYQRAMENRNQWRTLVVKSSVVPQRPSRLRDRWWCTSKKNLENAWYDDGFIRPRTIECRAQFSRWVSKMDWVPAGLAWREPRQEQEGTGGKRYARCF